MTHARTTILLLLGLSSSAAGCSNADQFAAAQQAQARADMTAIKAGLDLYYVQKGRYPEPAAGLGALAAERVMPSVPQDPWGRPYSFTIGPNGPRIATLGRDGAPGGAGPDADLSEPP